MASHTGAEADADGRNVSDAAGLVVLGACAAWSVITAAVHDGRPEGVLLAVLAVAAGHATGRIFGALLPVAAPCAAALAGLGLVLWVPDLVPGPQPLGPLGHAGATAAVLTLSTGAACCAAWAAAAPALRLALRLLATGITVAAGALAPAPAVAACAAVLLASLAAGRVRHRGPGLAALTMTAALVAGLVWAAAADALPTGLTSALDGGLTDHRLALWRDALHQARQESGTGVGPARFEDFSPTAAQTLLSDGKPHSAPLQQAAEQGAVGALLLAAAFCWVLYALWRTPRTTPVALTAGTALTAVAAVAAVGNALSFTAVSVGAGLLAGLATARPLTDGGPPEAARARADGERPAR
ncbi:O-antigen ligase family protein [Streptomyces sp. MS06]|uniref:O-antigen ligase family protein n=1 Tax=Streptomyces sp. MS06 TaxID=3385974 RepID=UPI0039A2E6BE